MDLSEDKLRSLVEEIKRGNKESLGLIIEKVKLFLKSYFDSQKNSWNELLAHTQPEDLISEILEKISKDLPYLRYRGMSSFKAWVKKICNNHLKKTKKYFRAQKRNILKQVSIHKKVKQKDLSSQELVNLINADDTTPSNVLMREERINITKNIISNLKPDYRTIIELRFIKGLSTQDIASQMDRKEGAVRILLMRAMREFDREFKKIKKHIDPDSTVFK